MRNIAVVLGIAVFVLTASAARALEATGWIIGLDPQNDEITLGNGQSFVVPDDIGMGSLSENTCVRIRYETVHGVRVMTAISPVMQPGAARRSPRPGAAVTAACQ